MTKQITWEHLSDCGATTPSSLVKQVSYIIQSSITTYIYEYISIQFLHLLHIQIIIMLNSVEQDDGIVMFQYKL